MRISKICPFAEYIAMTSKNACRLKSGMYSRCNLECGKECDKLKECRRFDLLEEKEEYKDEN